jgi:hypothetical protein
MSASEDAGFGDPFAAFFEHAEPDVVPERLFDLPGMAERFSYTRAGFVYVGGACRLLKAAGLPFENPNAPELSENRAIQEALNDFDFLADLFASMLQVARHLGAGRNYRHITGRAFRNLFMEAIEFVNSEQAPANCPEPAGTWSAEASGPIVDLHP